MLPSDDLQRELAEGALVRAGKALREIRYHDDQGFCPRCHRLCREALEALSDLLACTSGDSPVLPKPERPAVSAGFEKRLLAMLDLVDAVRALRAAGPCPRIRKFGSNKQWLDWQAKQDAVDSALARLEEPSVEGGSK